MIGVALVIFVVCLLQVAAFTPRSKSVHRMGVMNRASTHELAMSTELTETEAPLSEEVSYDGLAISGFTSKETNIAEPFVFLKLFMTTKWNSITAVTDDLSYTRKLMTTPQTVYSGLIDAIKYSCLSDEVSMESAVKGNEAWIAFNVSSSELSSMADIAVKNGVKRAVFAVPVGEDEAGADVTFDPACDKMKSAGVDYTIIKFGANSASRMGEAKFPYRIVRGESALPEGGEILSSDDLMRIITEVIDLPKTFNTVYGIGPGSHVDREILSYMKSQGWPERVQIGLLCGDFMEKIEDAYEKEKEAIESGKMNAPKKKKKIEGSKFAGFAPI